MTKNVGVLTAGGDTPGLNAALRGLGKSAMYKYDLQLVGFYDGFRGLLNDRCIILDDSSLSGILTIGGTILGTSRVKPHKMEVGGNTQDMRDAMVDTYHKHHLDVLVCMGGGGTQKNAYGLMEKGLNILTLPKTIDMILPTLMSPWVLILPWVLLQMLWIAFTAPLIATTALSLLRLWGIILAG